MTRPKPAKQLAASDPFAPVSMDPRAPAENDPAASEEAAVTDTRAALDALRRRVASQVLTPEVLAHYRAQVSDADAAQTGRRLTTQDVVDDLLDGVPGVLDAVLAGRVRGFGPLAMRYTLDLGGELLTHWHARREHEQARSAASLRKSVALDAVLAGRTELAGMLDGALPADDPERATLARAATVSRRTLGHALTAVESMTAIAERVFTRAEADPSYEAFLRDQQFTREAVARVVGPLGPALAARDAHRGARNDSGVEQQRIDELEGRLRDQLMRLRHAVESARARGVKLPEVPAARVRARAANRRDEPEPSPPAPQPAPAPEPR